MIVVNTLSCIITRERFVVGHLIILLASSSILLTSPTSTPVYLLHHLIRERSGHLIEVPGDVL